MMPRYPKVPAKVGTIPMLIWLRSRKPLAIGKKIEFRDCENGRWMTGIVTSLSPLRLDLM